MVTLTDRNSVITQAIVDLLRGDWETLKVDRPDDIYYGDQSKYPRTPAIAVEPGNKSRELNQTGLQQRIQLTMYVLIFHGTIATASTRLKEIDEVSELVEARLHTDRRLGGLVIHGHPVSNEPGFTNRGGALLVTHRITWEGISNHTM